jgi:hypothetical protein
MKAIYDLIAGGAPPPVELLYNGDLAADSTTKRYKGSLVKLMDYDDIDHGKFLTFAGLTTAMENVAGILEEEQGITTNYLLDNGTYSARYRKITPIFPSTVIEAEYSPKDAAAGSNVDNGATGSAGSATLTITVVDNSPIGGWIYFLTGANAGFLHYIYDTSTTAAALLSPVLNYAVVSADTFLVIPPPMTGSFLPDATYTGLKSEIDSSARTYPGVGISTWIEATGIGKTKLDFAKHHGLKIAGAKFYHQFTFPGTSTYTNLWLAGIKLS